MGDPIDFELEKSRKECLEAVAKYEEIGEALLEDTREAVDFWSLVFDGEATFTRETWWVYLYRALVLGSYCAERYHVDDDVLQKRIDDLRRILARRIKEAD
jgi:hypothetical protein